MRIAGVGPSVVLDAAKGGTKIVKPHQYTRSGFRVRIRRTSILRMLVAPLVLISLFTMFTPLSVNGDEVMTTVFPFAK